MQVKILTDSACDLPLDFYQIHHVTLFPLKVQINGMEYEDVKSIAPEKVYEAIRNGMIPKTAQTSPHLFEEVFSDMADKEEDGIYIAFSSALSGTYQTAVMILNQVKEKYPNFSLTILDTKCASLGQGLIVKEAVRLAEANVPKEEILKAIKFQAHHMEHLFTVDDLEYLAKGGRVSKASAFLGGLLNIKPLLDVQDGSLVPLEKIRGKKKLFHRIIEIMSMRGENLHEQTIGISHAANEEAALQMQAMVEESFHPKEVVMSTIGSAIGAHAGAGTIAVFFLNELPKK